MVDTLQKIYAVEMQDFVVGTELMWEFMGIIDSFDFDNILLTIPEGVFEVKRIIKELRVIKRNYGLYRAPDYILDIEVMKLCKIANRCGYVITYEPYLMN